MVSGAWVRAHRMSRVGIIAALPGELKPLVQGWNSMPLPGTRKGEAAWFSRVDDVECVAVYAGIGSEAAAHACAIAAQGGALDAIVSVGWAGATSCGIYPGNAYAVNEVIDALTDHIVQYAEKRKLAGLYQAVMVDMEAATVARFALSQNIPFYCLKAISDEIADILPDFGRYTDSDGHLRMAALLGHVSVRPKYWPAMARMGQNAKRGARAVAGALGPLLGEA
jgi:adenosylhomocysteine nucleosidase